MGEKVPGEKVDRTRDTDGFVGEMYGMFELGGARITAFLPAFPPDVWTVKIEQNGETRAYTLPMNFPPIFGPDVSDVQQLNEFIEILITNYNLE